MTKSDNNKDVAQLIEPLFDNIYIEPVDYEDQLPEGLLALPTKDSDKPLIGIVRAVPTRSYIDKVTRTITEPQTTVKIGEKVLYRKWSMSEFKHEGKELIVVAEKDITAVLHF